MFERSIKQMISPSLPKALLPTAEAFAQGLFEDILECAGAEAPSNPEKYIRSLLRERKGYITERVLDPFKPSAKPLTRAERNYIRVA